MPTATTNPRILGFDFGLRRIGVAAGNIRTGSCQGLCTIPATDGEPQWPAVQQLLTQWQPAKLVVGLPRDASGNDTAITKRARKFAAQISARCKLQVALVDEYLTTASAEEILKETTTAGKSQNRRRIKYRDALAAELIIRTYLSDENAAGL